jgi:hypothetical protein
MPKYSTQTLSTMWKLRTEINSRPYVKRRFHSSRFSRNSTAQPSGSITGVKLTKRVRGCHAVTKTVGQTCNTVCSAVEHPVAHTCSDFHPLKRRSGRTGRPKLKPGLTAVRTTSAGCRDVRHSGVMATGHMSSGRPFDCNSATIVNSVLRRSSPSWDARQRRLVVNDVSGQPIANIFKGQAWPD